MTELFSDIIYVQISCLHDFYRTLRKYGDYLLLTSFWFIVSYMFVSCNDKREMLHHKFIPVESTVGNYNILNLSDFVMEIRYIPLETNDSVLIARISEINCENEQILIKDIYGLSYNCYLFDNNGKFYCKVGQRGQGPDDYNFLQQAFIHGDSIFLMDRNKMLIYDTHGILVDNINFQSVETPSKYRGANYMSNIFPVKKNTYIMNGATMDKYYPRAILFETVQSDVRILKEYPNVKLEKVVPHVSSDEIGIMYRCKDDVRLYKVWQDTVFTVDQNMEMKDAFIFQLGRFKPVPNFQADMLMQAAGRNRYIFPEKMVESRTHLFIQFSFGDHAPEPFDCISNLGNQSINQHVYGIFEKNTGKLTLLKQPVKGKLGFKNDIDHGPVIWPHYISSKNELVTYVSVEEFIDCYNKIEKPAPHLTELAKKIKSDDNQIVIVSKLIE